MKKIFTALTVLAALLLFSCDGGGEKLKIEPPELPLELTGSISSGELAIEGTLIIASEESAELCVNAPDQLAGYSWTMNPDGCSVSHSGVTAPLAFPPPMLSMLAEAFTVSGDALVSAEVTELGGQSYTYACYSGSLGKIAVYYAPANSGSLTPVRVEYGGVVMNITGLPE